jgi:DNA polymerase I-like protein with 3'-5' exonuclease and polymerase domains
VIRVGRRSRQQFGADVFRPVLEIHDQIISEVKIGFEQEGKKMVIEEMEKPMPMLNPVLGLEVDCEVKKSWGEGMK